MRCPQCQISAPEHVPETCQMLFGTVLDPRIHLAGLSPTRPNGFPVPSSEFTSLGSRFYGHLEFPADPCLAAAGISDNLPLLRNRGWRAPWVNDKNHSL